MREIKSAEVTAAVAELCSAAGFELPDDVFAGLVAAREKEESPMGQTAIDDIILNARIAGGERLPICQDTGLAVFFVDMGQEVALTGKALKRRLMMECRKDMKNFICASPLLTTLCLAAPIREPIRLRLSICARLRATSWK
jgi:Tartrate dehydratase alpha subunit/Fumarate hydratase class I, N-terminal domain